MSEPIKKIEQTPESYSPKKPEIANLMKEANEHMNEQLEGKPLYDSFEVVKSGPYRFIGKSVYTRAFDKKGSPEIHSSFRKQCDWIFEILDTMKEYASDEVNNAAIQHWEMFDQAHEGGTHWPGQLWFGGRELLGYTIGRFMKKDTPVPTDMDYIDIAELPIAKGWKKVEPRDDIGMPDEGTIFTAIEKTAEFGPASWMFAADIFPFVNKSGDLIRGTFMACVPLSEQEIAERAKDKKAAEESKKAKPMLIKKLENTVPRGKSVEIDLAAVEINQGINYTNGLLELRNQNMVTPQSFNAPLKIELRAKLEGCLLFIKYGKGHIIFDALNPNGVLFVQDIMGGKNYIVENFGYFPLGEFVDIEFVLATEFMSIKINGKLWHIGNNYGYINEFKVNPEYNLSSPVTIAPENSTVTIEKLRVTEI